VSEHDVMPIRKPRADDSVFQDIENAMLGYLSVYVAHKLKLFSLLNEKPRTLAEVCQSLNLARRPAEAILIVGLALGLLQKQGESYALTALSEDYLLETSPFYWGHALDLDITLPWPPSLESLEKMLHADAHQIYGGGDWVQSHEDEPELALTFTRAMHSYSMAPALAWPEKVDLSGNRQMLDIGAGSGAHSICAALTWKNLHVITLDIASVCEITSEYIAQYNLQDRIHTHVCDIWHDPFPKADLHFYSMIYHDWPLEKNEFLTRKSFDSLESGGRLIIHEMLFNNDKAGPFTIAAHNVSMLWCAEGEQYSGNELTKMLDAAGFVDITVTKTFGYWSIVTGLKP
jgi:protein-L-isoaspartate O-methyltransferase